MLEGSELEQSYDNGSGKVIVDVDSSGGLKISNVWEKDLDGFAKVKNATDISTNIFVIAEKIAAKTDTKWDDQAVDLLKKALGIK